MTRQVSVSLAFGCATLQHPLHRAVADVERVRDPHRAQALLTQPQNASHHTRLETLRRPMGTPTPRPKAGEVVSFVAGPPATEDFAGHPDSSLNAVNGTPCWCNAISLARNTGS
jgi:hypothetical protein